MKYNFIILQTLISGVVIMDETELHENGNKTGLIERSLFMWMWKNGQSVRCIAKQTGRSPTTVRRWVRRLQKEEYLQTKLFRANHLMPIFTFPFNNVVHLCNTSESVSLLDSMLDTERNKILTNYFNEYHLSLFRRELPITLKKTLSLKEKLIVTHRILEIK